MREEETVLGHNHLWHDQGGRACAQQNNRRKGVRDFDEAAQTCWIYESSEVLTLILSPFANVSLEMALNSRVSSGGGGDHFGQPSDEPITPEQLEFVFQCLRHTPQISRRPHSIRCERGDFNPRDFTLNGQPLVFEPLRRLVVQWVDPSEEPENQVELTARWLDRGMGLELAHVAGAIAQVGVCILGGESVELTSMIPYLSAEAPSGFLAGNLPRPLRNGTRPAVECIENRRFSHSFSSEAPTLEEIGQILWAGFGCTPHTTHSGDTGDPYRRQGKTIPSGNAVYDLVLYTLTEAGVAIYVNWDFDRSVPTHSLESVRKGMFIPTLLKCLPRVPEASAYIVAASLGKFRRKSAVMEAGYAGLNISLQAEALGLGCHISALTPEETEAIQRGLSLRAPPTVVMSIGYGKR